MAAEVASGFIEHLVINYRWLFVCFFLLPISVVYDAYFYLRNWLVFKIRSAPKQHEKRVRNIQRQVREWIASGRGTKMCTARPGWMTMSFRIPKYKETMTNIDCNLMDILEVDTNRRVVRVEPMVNMGQITALLLPAGWTLAVVPELDDLTVGGLIMGCGIETSSHKYGLMQDICESFEMVMADGSVVNCSKEENADLFASIPWSHGTLGFLASAELKIIPAKPYVKLEYIPCTTIEDGISEFEKQTQEPANDFLEGLAFDLDHFVIMPASFSDEPPDETLINRIGTWHKPWFFKHVQSFLSKGRTTKHVEYIPIRDYYHRHSRSIFWELGNIVPFGNNPIFRYLFGWAVPPKVGLLKQTQTAAIKKLYEEHHMLQDFLVPINNMQELLEKVDDAVQIYPLWLCPCKISPSDGMVHTWEPEAQFFVDIGAYGVPNSKGFSPADTTRYLESYVRSVKGFQLLYADTYMTRAEFREMFDHQLYDKVRAKYGCVDAFPEVYDKVSRKARS